MKKKIIILGIIVLLLVVVFILIGRGNGIGQQNQQDASIDKELIGTWTINTNINTSNKEKYGSLMSTFGDSLNVSSNSLTLNEDNTFSLEIGAYYRAKGNYNIDDNIISFSNVEDSNRSDDLEIAEKLKIEKIEYKEKILLQMKLFEITDADVYVYFGKTDNNHYDKSEIPQMNFEDSSNISKENELNNNQEELTNQDLNSEVLKVGEYTLKYGTYIGRYTKTQTESMADAYVAEKKIKINKDGTISRYEEVFGGWIKEKYTIEDNIIILNDSKMDFNVIANNTFKWGELTTLTYQE